MNDLINIEMNKNQDPVVSDRRLYRLGFLIEQDFKEEER